MKRRKIIQLPVCFGIRAHTSHNQEPGSGFNETRGSRAWLVTSTFVQLVIDRLYDYVYDKVLKAETGIKSINIGSLLRTDYYFYIPK